MKNQSSRTQELLDGHKICPGVRLFACLSNTPSINEIEQMDKEEGKGFLKKKLWAYYHLSFTLTFLPLFVGLLWIYVRGIPVWGWGLAVGLAWGWTWVADKFFGATQINENPQHLLDILGNNGCWALKEINSNVDFRTVARLDLAVVFLSRDYACAKTSDKLGKIAAKSRPAGSDTVVDQQKNRRVM